METQLLLGDCLDQLKNIKDNTIDSIVTDPPYGLSFMGKKWDYDVPSTEIWEECIRVLKPGGHLLSFAGSRTYHRMAVRIEDAGFEIRDQIMWIYGSGFPKSHNIGKSVDKVLGNEREIVDTKEQTGAKFKEWSNDPNETRWHNQGFNKVDGKEFDITKGNSEWEGWGTALKPAHEPIVMARKPLVGTVANNVLEWGVGGINIDGCRIGNEVRTTPIHSTDTKEDNTLFGLHSTIQHERVETTEGRFPANIIFECTCDNPKVVADKYDIRTYNDYKNTFQSYEENDKDKGEYEIKDVETTKVIHTDPNCPCYILDQQSGITSQGHWPKGKVKGFGEFGGGESSYEGVGPKDKEKGGASRFFYCPKASKKDRNEGCDAVSNPFKLRPAIGATYAGNQTTSKIGANPNKPTEPRANIHPTVKPTDLMGYLIRLVTPKGGVVLDPFTGSGSTGKAAVREGMQFIGIEREEEYFEIAKQRIEWEVSKKPNNKFW
jgi:site-specific DNA-methyltransferase (adenine-specific)